MLVVKGYETEAEKRTLVGMRLAVRIGSSIAGSCPKNEGGGEDSLPEARVAPPSDSSVPPLVRYSNFAHVDV